MFHNYKKIRKDYPIRNGAYDGRILDCVEKQINTKYGEKTVWQFDLLVKTERGDIRTSIIEFVGDNKYYNNLRKNLIETFGNEWDSSQHIDWDVILYFDVSFAENGKYYLHLEGYKLDDISLEISNIN